MKNTMKKLLCMALAIMLLVSAVPVFAAADANVHVTVTKDTNTTLVNEDKEINTEYSLRTALAPFVSEYTSTCNVTYLRNGAVANADDAVGDATSIGATLETMNAPIAIRFEDNSYSGQVWRPITGSVTLNEALLNEAMIYVPSNKQIAGWNVSGAAKATGATVSVDWNMSIVCRLEDKASEVGIITAKFSVDGANEVTMKFSANAKTVSELISLGNYSAYELDKAGLGGSGNKRDVNSLSATINAGETVYIKMKTPATPTNPSNPTNPATPSTSNYIKFAVKVDSSSNVVYDGGKTPANGSSAKIGDLIKNLYDSNWASKYTFDYAWSNKNQTKITDVNATVYVGDTVTVMLKSNNGGGSTTTTGILNLIVNVNDSLYKSYAIADFTQNTINNLLKSKLGSNWADSYSYNNTVVGGVTYNNADVIVKAGQTATVSLSRKYSKDNSNKVYLHVYLNGDASTIAMTKDITGTYLMDDWYTDTTEILNYLKNNYYSAKDTSNAVTIDGLYVNTGSDGTFPANYYADKTQSSVRDIKDKLESGYVHISVMLKNAKAKSTATADSSNPKTGDTIFVPFMVMGLTATALAAAYVFGKKRIAR